MTKCAYPATYQSPRWSGEILDCSMPMVLDTYSMCSYNCLYCFAFYQKINIQGPAFRKGQVKCFNVERIKQLFMNPEGSPFANIIKSRKVIQWGGLAEPFDEFERKAGQSLELLRFFREIDYPISISTKGVWWIGDPRYTEVIKGAKNFHFKVSIITMNEEKGKKIEIRCPTTTGRLALIKRLAELGVGGVTLRFRPFIIGLSNPGHRELIRIAAEQGADSMSTEFFCLESRAGTQLKHRFARISKVLGFDIYKYYLAMSKRSGYKRLERLTKRPFIEDMKDEADLRGIRFYVSDADFKELSANGSCCGLDENWNYSRGQFTEAAVRCRKNGNVKFSEISKELAYAKKIPLLELYGHTTLLGTSHGDQAKNLAKMGHFSLYDYFRYMWNHPNHPKAPYKYFGGALRPVGLDPKKNVVYKYNGEAGK